MSYQWTSASTPQGRERLKELISQKIEVVCKHEDGTLFRAYTDMEWYIWVDGNMFFSWDEFEEDDSFFDFEFLDPSPSPSPEPVADENGLLPCPFCGGKGMYEVFDEIKYSNVHDIECGIQCQGCYTSVKIEIDRKKNTREYAKTQAIALWNRRAGKETNT